MASKIFALFLLISLAFLLWSVISPRSFNKHTKKPLTRKDGLLGFGVIALVFAVLTGVTAPKSDVVPASHKTAAVSQIKPSSSTPVRKLPVITTKTVVETSPIAPTATTISSPSYNKGTSQVTTTGVSGVMTSTYTVTYKDGVQTSKTLVSQVITKPAVNQVTTIGTYVKPAPVATTTQPKCDPNYTGACVPDVYPQDVDCGGGSGNGPYYVYGEVHVVGVDRYHLDADGDGYGCE